MGSELVQLGPGRAACNGLKCLFDAVGNRVGLVACINGQAGVKGYDITSRPGDVVERLEHHGGRLFAVAHLDAPVRHHGHAEVFGVDFILAHLAVAQLAYQGGSAQRPFVHAVFAMHDQHVLGAQTLEYAHLNADQVGVI